MSACLTLLPALLLLPALVDTLAVSVLPSIWSMYSCTLLRVSSSSLNSVDQPDTLLGTTAAGENLKRRLRSCLHLVIYGPMDEHIHVVVSVGIQMLELQT
jgi:hypothetical protein